MGLFRRRSRRDAAAGRADGAGGGAKDGSKKAAKEAAERAERATREHLEAFVRSRVGVEAYVEPVTHVTQTTVVLIATTGEWTRRRVPDPATAWALAQELGIPVYDVQLTGYPQRMRAWNASQRRRR